jgi:hypothetical protein
MAGGGKGGSTTSQVEVPAWLNDAAQGNLAKAQEMSKTGFAEYRGPDVAAFTPMQMASFQNTQDAANAFGVAAPAGGPMAGMPAPTMYANGVQGYSSAPIYDQAKAEMKRLNPAQYAAITAPFINPVTGAAPAPVYASAAPAPVASSAKTSVPVAIRSEPAQGSAASRNTKYDTYSTKADTAARAKASASKSSSKGKK